PQKTYGKADVFRHKPLAGRTASVQCLGDMPSRARATAMRPDRPYVGRCLRKIKAVLFARPTACGHLAGSHIISLYGEYAGSPSDGFRPSSAQLSFCREDARVDGTYSSLSAASLHVPPRPAAVRPRAKILRLRRMPRS